MSILDICHRTTYQYRREVALGAHRLMLWPRTSRQLRLTTSELSCHPAADIAWTDDVFGNSIAWASFAEPAAVLSIESRIQLELTASDWPVFRIAPSAQSFPFCYDEDDRTDLAAMRTPQYPDPENKLKSWALNFVRGPVTDTLSLLKDMNVGISSWILYQIRNDDGTQPPLESLERGKGSCRDFALLMAEAARHLGFAARIVSGYLFVPPQEARWSSTSGSTHAWLEIYIPGAGWISFDPTNRNMGGANLIPVAVVRDIRQAVPVSGSFSGKSDDLLSMNVNVTVAKLS